MRCQVRAGLNMAMAGIPWWTTDIGGFDSGDPEDDDYKELTIRWFQYATFCPVLRMHGYQMPYIPADEGAKGGGQCYTGGDNEIWSYGEKAFEIMREHVFYREKMKPYIKNMMEQAHVDGIPPMRPLFYAFPEDKACWDIEDEYMFGDKLLICPVCELGIRQREVYLPKGKWKNVFTGEIYEGARTIMAEAPIEYSPVYERL